MFEIWNETATLSEEVAVEERLKSAFRFVSRIVESFVYDSAQTAAFPVAVEKDMSFP